MKLTARIKPPTKLNAKFNELKMPLNGGFEEGYSQGYAAGYESGYAESEMVAAGLIDGAITDYGNERVTGVVAYMFYMNPRLTSVDFPNAKTIGEGAFGDCVALADINFPVAEILEIGAFQFTPLVSVKFPSVKTVGHSVFMSCKSLKIADFYVVESFETNNFQNCTALDTLILRGAKVATIANAILRNTPIANGTGYIYIPRALVDSYKSATNWSIYADQFRALEDYTVDGTITGELDESKI